jgi:hypothetical protein
MIRPLQLASCLASIGFRTIPVPIFPSADLNSCNLAQLQHRRSPGSDPAGNKSVSAAFVQARTIDAIRHEYSRSGKEERICTTLRVHETKIRRSLLSLMMNHYCG